jgi:hypothetical protein
MALISSLPLQAESSGSVVGVPDQGLPIAGSSREGFSEASNSPAQVNLAATSDAVARNAN